MDILNTGGDLHKAYTALKSFKNIVIMIASNICSERFEATSKLLEIVWLAIQANGNFKKKL